MNCYINTTDFFDYKLGSVKDMKVKLFVEKNSKACALPLALCDKVSDKLDNIYAKGVIVPVKFSSSWAAPVVLVIKRDGNDRLCGDFKLTINSVAKNEVYPCPELKSIWWQGIIKAGPVVPRLPAAPTG